MRYNLKHRFPLLYRADFEVSPFMFDMCSKHNSPLFLKLSNIIPFGINVDPENHQILWEPNLPTSSNPYLAGSMLIYWRVSTITNEARPIGRGTGEPRTSTAGMGGDSMGSSLGFIGVLMGYVYIIYVCIM